MVAAVSAETPARQRCGEVLDQRRTTRRQGLRATGSNEVCVGSDPTAVDESREGSPIKRYSTARRILVGVVGFVLLSSAYSVFVQPMFVDGGGGHGHGTLQAHELSP